MAIHGITSHDIRRDPNAHVLENLAFGLLLRVQLENERLDVVENAVDRFSWRVYSRYYVFYVFGRLLAIRKWDARHRVGFSRVLLVVRNHVGIYSRCR